MEFSVFDHLDLVPGQDLTSYYEDRLNLVECYDEIGIRSYHPLRLMEEVCMLDQMSSWRLE